MAVIDHSSRLGSAAYRAVSMLAIVVDLAAATWRALLNRRHVSRLEELSDHQLADLGLTRSDLNIALHAPLNTDPTARLTTLARERYWTERRTRPVR